ncbi:MAG: hypothetical protein NTV70_22755 [Acidobacteria bacterium]|nr:hypothetical protein [Acidobacteriota bacterium]
MIRLLNICRELGRRALGRLRRWRRERQWSPAGTESHFETVELGREFVVASLEPTLPALPADWAPVSRHVVRDPLQALRRLAPLLPDGAEGVVVTLCEAEGFRQLHLIRFGARRPR